MAAGYGLVPGMGPQQGFDGQGPRSVTCDIFEKRERRMELPGSSLVSFAFRLHSLVVLGLVAALCGCLDSQQKSLETGADRTQAVEEGGDTVTAPPDTIFERILEQRRFLESPLLAEQVKSGQLPPVHLRLPEVPLVIRPIAEIGQYGGTLRRALTAECHSDKALIG